MKNYCCLIIVLLIAQIYPQKFDEKIIDQIITTSLPINGPGGTMLIKKGNEKVYEKSFGFSDKENSIMNDESTVYQIGSISKQFTGTGIAHQVSNFIFGIDEDKRAAADVPAEELKKYEGIFISNLFHLKAEADNNKLSIKTVDLPFHAVNFIPSGETDFFGEGLYGVYLKFNNENELVYDDNGQKMKFYREGTEPKFDTLALTETELKIYEGAYSFAPGNEMNVFLEEGSLRATIPGQPKYTLLPVAENEFILEGLQGFKMIFKLDEKGKVISVTSSQPNGDFNAEKISDEIKKPEKIRGIQLGEEELKKFEGEYEFAPSNTMRVTVKDGKLKAELPNQPVYTLIPVAENEFKLDELDGFKMTFKFNENNEVVSVTSHQPNGSFTAVKKE